MHDAGADRTEERRKTAHCCYLPYSGQAEALKQKIYEGQAEYIKHISL